MSGIKQALGSKVRYTAPPERNQSMLSDTQARKLKNRGSRPKHRGAGRPSSGLGVGY